jgi:hypothetical protein
MTYQGNKPFSGLSQKQTNAIEAAARHAPDDWHDGIWRNVHDQLAGAGPWGDVAVDAAIKQVLSDLGIPSNYDLKE